MKPAQAVVLPLILLCVLGVGHSKPKKPAVPVVFQNARYVYVEAVSGDIMKPGLYPEDRQAIADVTDGLRDWKRYAITPRREQADLVFVVRKGRLVGEQDHVGVSNSPGIQSPQPGGLNPGQPGSGMPSQGRGPAPMGGSTEMGAAAEVGPPEDLLRVYTLNPDGKLIGPVWSREMEDGLSAPAVRLLAQLKDAVEKAYPPEAAKPPAP